MKKTLLIIIALIFLVSAFSFGEVRKGGALGLEGVGGWSYGYGGLGGVALTFKIPKLPIMWAVDGNFGIGWFHVGATADWWMLDNQIAGPLYWYWGLGLFGGIWTGGGLDAAFGGRVPIGFQFWLFEVTGAPSNLELFIEVAPSVGLRLGSRLGTGLHFAIPAAVGGRWWF